MTKNRLRADRYDGRKSYLIRVRLNQNERKLVQDLTTTDERRQALMAAAERKRR